MEGTSNKTIVSFFAEKTSDVVKIIFVGVFPSNYVIRFISFHSIMTESVALFFLSKLSTIYILTNRTIIYIYIYIYIYIIYILCIYIYIYLYIYIYI